MDLLILTFFIPLFLFIIKPLFFYQTKKTPPGPKGLPIIGALLELGSKPNQSLAGLAKIYGPLMTLKLGSITTIVASSAEAAKEILQKQEQIFSERTIPDVITAQPNPEATIVWVPGDHVWRNKRRLCSTQLFNDRSSLQHLRHEKVQEMIHYIKRNTGSPVDIGHATFVTTLNLVSNTIFSIDIVDSEFGSAQEFKDLVCRIMEDAGKPNLSDFFPVLKWLDVQGIKRHIKPSYTRLHEIFDEVIGKRLENRAKNEIGNGDFLDVLLDQCEDTTSGFDLQTIKPMILDLFIAGSDTSSITTEWAMAELLRKPETMQKLRQEIIKIIGFEKIVQESDIEKLPYLQAVVKETMRLLPAAPLLLPHKAQKETQLFGYIIPEDSQVLVNAWAIGRDEKYWENPNAFKPKRFMGCVLDYKGRDFEYIPFGAGRRICPGMPLAVRMVSLNIVPLLSILHLSL